MRAATTVMDAVPSASIKEAARNGSVDFRSGNRPPPFTRSISFLLCTDCNDKSLSLGILPILVVAASGRLLEGIATPWGSVVTQPKPGIKKCLDQSPKEQNLWHCRKVCFTGYTHMVVSSYLRGQPKVAVDNGRRRRAGEARGHGEP